MRRHQAQRLLRLTVACVTGLAPPCAAQVDGRLDAGVAVVKYEGYLSAGAASLTPSLTWRFPRTTLAARGTVLVYETGHTNLQALVSASTFSPPLGSLRLEAAADAGASAYSAFAQFAHVLARLQLHVLGGWWGLHAGPLAGAAWSDRGTPHGASGISAGVWGHSAWASLEATWSSVTVGDTSYRDLQGRAQWRGPGGAFTLEAGIGARITSPGARTRTYGDLAVTAPITLWMDLVIAAGTYPRDPVRGTIPGRYVTAGVRLAPHPREAMAQGVAASLPPGAAPPRATLAECRVAVEQGDSGSVLVVEAVGARLVEVMGDFTGWQPVALAAAGEGRYRYALPLPAGVQRFNVRLDGGPWGVPQGAALEADDFGGSVGVLVVPW